MPLENLPDANAALAAVRDYHQRTKHRFEAYARGPGTLDWDEQPAPFRDFAGASKIALPRLDAVAAGSALAQALARPFAELGQQAPLPLGLDTLGALLQLSLGLTAWKTLGPDRWAVRANPSSGNLHPTEAYLLLSGVDGLEDGLYHYLPDIHGLELRARHPQTGGAPRLAIVLTSVMWREAWKYGERAFRYCQLDSGHAAGALRYAAAVLGWTLALQPQIGSETLARLSGIDRREEFPARRAPETECEEAEILLAAGLDGQPPAPPAATELQALAQAAEWFGIASPIDRHPMYRWPLVGEIAAATRLADGAAPIAPALGAAPAYPPGAGRKGAARLISERRSAQRFDHYHQMPFSQFAELLGRLHPFAGFPWDVGAGLPRIALLLFVSHVQGLEPGLYLLPRSPGQLADLRPRLDPSFEFAEVPEIAGLWRLRAYESMAFQRLARSLHCHQDLAANACFAVGMLAEFDAALAADGPAAYRALYREAGLIGQVLYLEAEAQNLRGTGIGCFFDDPVHELLGLGDSAWQSLYHFTVGLPIVDPRIESAPAYADAPSLP